MNNLIKMIKVTQMIIKEKKRKKDLKKQMNILIKRKKN